MKKMLTVLIMVVGVSLLAACSSNGSSSTGTGNGGPSTNTSSGSNESKETITINISEDDYGARMDNYRAALQMLNEELAEQGKNVEVVANFMPAVNDNERVLQGQSGRYADIFMNSSVDIGWQLDAGLIQPIDWLKDSEVYATLPERLWDIMTYQGHVYGAIQDMDASPLFINKRALTALGWTEQQIAELPDRVLKGEFTMDDLLQVAADGVQQGAAKYGIGCNGLDNICIQVINNQLMGFEPYDMDESKTIVDQQGMMRTFEWWKKGLETGAITKDFTALEDVGYAYLFNEEIMFWIGGTGTYRYIKEASGLSDEEFEEIFMSRFAFTLIPAGQQGGTPGSLANPRLYFVGPLVDEEKMPYAQRIIELAMSPHLQIDHTLFTNKLPVTKAAQEDSRFESLAFLSEAAYMLDYTGVRPPHLVYPTYRDTYKIGLEAILTKNAAAEAAYDLFIQNFQPQVTGDDVIYR